MKAAMPLCELPPLILYPFDHRPDSDEQTQVPVYDPLTKVYLETRYNEFRILCLIGKDLNRWLGQCVELGSRDPELKGLSECDFIAVLLFYPPLPVLQKLRSWGAKNYQMIFSRAIGLNAVFPHPPSFNDVSADFLRDLGRYADALYDARLRVGQPAANHEDRFTFEILVSGEHFSFPDSSWAD
jgi:hypothetical protein